MVQCAHSQNNAYKILTKTDKPPKLKYKGGLEKFINDSITWPGNYDVVGNVVVLFTVTKEGRVENIRISKKLSPDFDGEVIRVLKKIPKCQAGKLDNKNIDVEIECTIRFQISE